MSPGNSYGTWPSPLSARVLAAGGVRVGGVARRGDVTWWAEARPAEAGRTVLVSRTGSAPAEDRLAEPWSARSQAHEYGGGAWWMGVEGVYFVNWADQRLYRIDGGEPVALTPEPPAPRSWRYADGREHPSDPWVVCVRERHPTPEPEQGDQGSGGGEAINELVAIATSEANTPVVLAAGLDGEQPQADFVAAPRFSADGRWLSWIRWDHPRMPWDGSELCVAPVFAGMRLGNIQVISGNEGESIQGADWTADGRLVFSTDRAGYWNLHAWTPGSAEDQVLTRLVGAEIGAPAWEFGTQQWVELDDGRLAVVITRDATDYLAVVDGNVNGDGAGEPTSIPSPFVTVDGLAATDSGTLVVHGSGPKSLASVTELNLDGTVVADIRPPDDIGVDPGWFSVAESVRYTSGPNDEREVQAFVYLPHRPDGVDGVSGELPPLVVMGHGGPTGHSSPALNLRAQYWTTRGFAVADVNYGGSSGFGRVYRRLLDDSWGIVDVEDCIAIATRLADDGVVDRNRMAIRGGSAGGFTVLSALVSSDVFSAGTNLFGVADLGALARDTHKFESRYLDGLVGPYPERSDIYDERSPINHTDRLSCPLLVLQGLEDEVVPPNQSEAIVAAVAAKGIPHAYVPFEGEQHGFRQEANIIRSYEVELWFYGRVFDFEPADEIEAPSGAVGL